MADDSQRMIDDLLSTGMKRLHRARVAVDALRFFAWAILIFGALGIIALVVTAFSEEEPELFGVVLYSFFGGGAVVAVMFAIVALLDLAAARFELALWESSLFADDEPPT